jgi:hypothetical protein
VDPGIGFDGIVLRYIAANSRFGNPVSTIRHDLKVGTDLRAVRASPRSLFSPSA